MLGNVAAERLFLLILFLIPTAPDQTCCHSGVWCRIKAYQTNITLTKKKTNNDNPKRATRLRTITKNGCKNWSIGDFCSQKKVLIAEDGKPTYLHFTFDEVWMKCAAMVKFCSALNEQDQLTLLLRTAVASWQFEVKTLFHNGWKTLPRVFWRLCS